MCTQGWDSSFGEKRVTRRSAAPACGALANAALRAAASRTTVARERDMRQPLLGAGPADLTAAVAAALVGAASVDGVLGLHVVVRAAVGEEPDRGQPEDEAAD